MNQKSPQDHGETVFVFTEIITPIEGRDGDILEISKKTVALLKDVPGVIQTMLTKSEKSGGPVSTITVWQSKADFQNFLKSDATKALLKSDDMANVKAWMSDYTGLMSDYVDGWHG